MPKGITIAHGVQGVKIDYNNPNVIVKTVCLIFVLEHSQDAWLLRLR